MDQIPKTELLLLRWATNFTNPTHQQQWLLTQAAMSALSVKKIVTGSHRKERTCLTVAQKEKERRAAEENIQSNDIMNSRKAIDAASGGG